MTKTQRYTAEQLADKSDARILINRIRWRLGLSIEVDRPVKPTFDNLGLIIKDGEMTYPPPSRISQRVRVRPYKLWWQWWIRD